MLRLNEMLSRENKMVIYSVICAVVLGLSFFMIFKALTKKDKKVEDDFVMKFSITESISIKQDFKAVEKVINGFRYIILIDSRGNFSICPVIQYGESKKGE